jgi:hypothetical protein
VIEYLQREEDVEVRWGLDEVQVPVGGNIPGAEVANGLEDGEGRVVAGEVNGWEVLAWS